nr:MAG TPA: hypothetical protein [Caudoviricetes sp.]
MQIELRSKVSTRKEVMARTIQTLSLCESMDWTGFGLEWTKI